MSKQTRVIILGIMYILAYSIYNGLSDYPTATTPIKIICIFCECIIGAILVVLAFGRFFKIRKEAQSTLWYKQPYLMISIAAFLWGSDQVILNWGIPLMISRRMLDYTIWFIVPDILMFLIPIFFSLVALIYRSKEMVLEHEKKAQILIDSAEHIFGPPKYPLFILMLPGILLTIMVPIACIMVYSIILFYSNDIDLLASSPSYIFFHYPLLTITPFLLTVLLIYVIWHAEKKARDTRLELYPDKFIQYSPWQDEQKRHAHVIDYMNTKKILLKTKAAGCILEVHHTDSTRASFFITNKYNLADAIAQKIINDHQHFLTRHQRAEGAG